MNLSELRDLIRAEANIQGLDEYTTLIDAIINQELQRITGKSKYQELLTEFTYTSALTGTYGFDLPADFQLWDFITFSPIEGSLAYGRPFNLSKGFARGHLTNTYGVPQFFHRVGNRFNVYPFTEFYLNDRLILSYYKRPVLLLDSDVFPVESLIPAVQQYVMARMLGMTDSKKSLIVRRNAEGAYIDSRSEDAGN